MIQHSSSLLLESKSQSQAVRTQLSQASEVINSHKSIEFYVRSTASFRCSGSCGSLAAKPLKIHHCEPATQKQHIKEADELQDFFMTA